MDYQCYLKDCCCEIGGIILYEGRAVCRWCRKPYGKGGYISYQPEHFKTKLFTTEDGVDIYEGDNWWVVNLDYDVFLNDSNKGHTVNHNFNGKRFSQRHLAYQYVLMNKQLLSLEEIFNHLCLSDVDKKKLIKLVENVLYNNKNNRP